MNPMMKLSVLAVMAVCAACGVAADPAPAKPAGVRVGYTLILFGCEDTVVKAAGTGGRPGGLHATRQRRGGRCRRQVREH